MNTTFPIRNSKPPSHRSRVIQTDTHIPLAILQRVLSATVTVDSTLVSAIGRGVLVFAAMAPGDTEREADTLAAKVLKMKLWDDDEGGRVGDHTLKSLNSQP